VAEQLNANFIFSWNHHVAMFHDFSGNLIYRYRELTKMDEGITDMIVVPETKHFVISTLKGTVSIFKLHKSKILIHTFEESPSMVTSLKGFKTNPD
jgi:hypothetical protein